MTAPIRDQSSIDRLCRNIYGETREFLKKIDFTPPFEFKILNGPPIQNAEILFVGYQPGGGEKDAENEKAKGTHKGWPLTCEYATETWRLAPRMQRIFGIERLKRCVGTNAIFFRYPNADQYRRDVGEKRKAIERFCIEKVAVIVEAIGPKQIVTIGFAPLQMFGPTEVELISEKGAKAIIKVGTVAGRPAVGMIHLTGARPSRSDLDRIADRFRSN